MADPSTMPPELLAALAYQKLHIEDRATGKLIGVTWALWFIAALAVALRLYAERMLRNKLRVHDYLILLGLFLTTAGCVNACIGVKYGSGKHLILATPADLVGQAKLLYAFVMIYATASMVIKASVLLFFYVTFPNPKFKKAVWGVGIFVFAHFLTLLIGAIFQCTPINFNWNKTIQGKCINAELFFVIIAALNALTDVVIIALPIPLIWNLNLPKARKLGVIGIFALSSIVIIASIIRPIYLQRLSVYDITYEGIDLGLWCIVELALGIVGACMPLMAPLFRQVKEMTTRKGSSNATNSTGWNSSRTPKDSAALPNSSYRKFSQSQTSLPPGYAITTDEGTLRNNEEWVERRESEHSTRIDTNNRRDRDLEMQNLPKTFLSR